MQVILVGVEATRLLHGQTEAAIPGVGGTGLGAIGEHNECLGALEGKHA